MQSGDKEPQSVLGANSDASCCGGLSKSTLLAGWGTRDPTATELLAQLAAKSQEIYLLEDQCDQLRQKVSSLEEDLCEMEHQRDMIATEQGRAKQEADQAVQNLKEELTIAYQQEIDLIQEEMENVYKKQKEAMALVESERKRLLEKEKEDKDMVVTALRQELEAARKEILEHQGLRKYKETLFKLQKARVQFTAIAGTGRGVNWWFKAQIKADEAAKMATLKRQLEDMKELRYDLANLQGQINSYKSPLTKPSLKPRAPLNKTPKRTLNTVGTGPSGVKKPAIKKGVGRRPNGVRISARRRILEGGSCRRVC
ncbi:hypothetical protein CBR_g50999 [Chara braunii]|uniref:Uncharacterized protein n=1 Tax=Chara braunii TaxID=69332 RepID=A0A388M7W2_CHABU|nr:hypothetical protein CBR_g50999 [Chara braunii]|eukprot:GBG90651.1 hypothetical protein CBR_g50999 [Chara braunii]